MFILTSHQKHFVTKETFNAEKMGKHPISLLMTEILEVYSLLILCLFCGPHDY